MRIIPYVSAVGVPFGSADESVVTLLGREFKTRTNRIGQVELDYGTCTFRLSKDEKVLVEATLNSDYFQIDGCSLPSTKKDEIAFVELGYVVAKLDHASFEAHGFIVSPMFGIAFDPHCPSWLTVFAKNELHAWRQLA